MHRPATDPGEFDVRLEGANLAPERVAAGGHIQYAEMVAIEHDHAGARAEHGLAGAYERPQRLGQALALDPERHHGGLPAGDDQRVQALEVGGHADLARLRAQRPHDLRVGLEIALQREDPDDLH